MATTEEKLMVHEGSVDGAEEAAAKWAKEESLPRVDATIS
jgi:hypothetical protein